MNADDLKPGTRVRVADDARPKDMTAMDSVGVVVSREGNGAIVRHSGNRIYGWSAHELERAPDQATRLGKLWDFFKSKR